MQIFNKFLRFSKLYIIFSYIVLFLIIFSTSYLHANAFKVSNIEISSSFELNFQKNTVIDDGFKTSFINLLSMITTTTDKKKIKNTPIIKIKEMIDSFTISKEKFVDNEYFAILETTFNKKKVLKFLENKNIFPSAPIKNKVLLIPILFDTEKVRVDLYDENPFYNKWNNEKNNFQLLEYFLPSEDLDDLNNIQEEINNIEVYDFNRLVKKYDIKDHIILIVYKTKNEVKILSKINLDNSTKLINKTYSEINLQNEINIEKLIIDLKDDYEIKIKNNDNDITYDEIIIKLNKNYMSNNDYKHYYKILQHFLLIVKKLKTKLFQDTISQLLDLDEKINKWTNEVIQQINKEIFQIKDDDVDEHEIYKIKSLLSSSSQVKDLLWIKKKITNFNKIIDNMINNIDNNMKTIKDKLKKQIEQEDKKELKLSSDRIPNSRPQTARKNTPSKLRKNNINNDKNRKQYSPNNKKT